MRACRLVTTILSFALTAASVTGCHQAASTNARRGKTAAADGIRFENVARVRGIRCHYPQQPRPLRSLEAFGCGCAFLDYDNDGWQDVLLVGKPTVTLFRNNHGKFKDATTSTGLSSCQGDWKGCAVGDYDGDGFLDLLLTGYRCLALLKNDGGRRWLNVTAAAGLNPQNRGHWGSSAGFMDLDGNGTLDLVLLNYVIFGPKEKQYCELRPGVRSGCPPSQYRPEFPELWKNLGNGKFQDVTDTAGMREAHGKALVVAFADVNNDGRIDFYIGNDGEPADLMGNLGGLRFGNFGLMSGTAFSEVPGHALAAMGADWGDYNSDGHLDLVVTGFSDESYVIFRNLGNGQFDHAGTATGISGPTFKPLGFGEKWIDFDNDGWLDIVFANGHVYDNTNEIDPLSTFRQPLMLFHNQRGRKFVDLVPKLKGDVAQPILGRGLASGDFDNDGRVDVLVVDYEGEPLLLRNVSQTPHHWIKFDLRSDGLNRFAYGAKVTARAGRQVWVAHVSPASSYLSSSDPRIHFGLGNVTRLDTVTIRWGSGKTEVLRNVACDRIVMVKEGQTK